MATTSPEVPPLPHYSVPVLDPKTGLANPDWYSWFKLIEAILRQVRTEV